MLPIVAVSNLVALFVGFSPVDKVEFADKFKASVSKIETVVFIADFDTKGFNALGGTNSTDKQRMFVTMTSSGRSRIESFRENEPAWTVVNSGNEVVEWVADTNSWTKYNPTSTTIGSASPIVRQLLLPKSKYFYLPAKFGVSWLGATSSEWKRLDMAIRHKQSTLRLKSSEKDSNGVYLQFSDSFTHPDGSMHGNGSESLTIVFDSVTCFPVREKNVAGGGPFGIKITAGQMEFQYSNVVINQDVAESLFEFVPPAGATFISPDDPRFAPPRKLEGKAAPHFSLATVDGATSKLIDHKGKRPVLVVFWATWCGPCVQEIPFVRDLRSEHPSDDLAILAISSEPKIEDIVKFAKKKKMTYQVLHDPKKETAKAYQARAIPRTILIDRNGIVVKVWQGWSGDEEAKEIRSEIAKLLK